MLLQVNPSFLVRKHLINKKRGLFSSTIGLLMNLQEAHFRDGGPLRVKCRGTIAAEFWKRDVENVYNTEKDKFVKVLEVKESQWPGKKIRSFLLDLFTTLRWITLSNYSNMQYFLGTNIFDKIRLAFFFSLLRMNFLLWIYPGPKDLEVIQFNCRDIIFLQNHWISFEDFDGYKMFFSCHFLIKIILTLSKVKNSDRNFITI